MDNLLQLGLRFQTIFSGIHFVFHLFSWPLIIGFLKDYENHDNFNCIPKPSDFTRQRCYDNYISTLSPLLTPLDFAGITFGALGFFWVLFILTGALLRRRIKKEQNDQRKRHQSWTFMLVFVFHVCFQFVVLSVIIGLFCSFQALSFPAEFKCYQSKKTLSPPNQEAVNMTCNDVRYKEKTKLNIAIIVIMAISILCCILTVIHLVAKRKAFIEQLLGDIFDQEDDSATGIKLVGKYSRS